MKKIVCFGDSVTAMGTIPELGGYVARLADRYARRADVLARGFSGYTSRDGLQLVDEAVVSSEPDYVILSFGSVDSVLPGQMLHVPVAEYRANIEEMATRAACVGAWVILVTPPPVYERKTMSRTLEQTRLYAEACLNAARDMNLLVFDLFSAVQEVPDWETECIIEGIQLSKTGMDVLYQGVTKTLDRLHPWSRMTEMGLRGL